VPNLFTAIQEQLGLTLDAATAPASVLVIDRIERPSENSATAAIQWGIPGGDPWCTSPSTRRCERLGPLYEQRAFVDDSLTENDAIAF
jgi:hypothetical protein